MGTSLTFLPELERLRHLHPKMKLFLVAITVIGAIHHGHGTHITLDQDTSADITLNWETPACDLSTVLEGALAQAKSEEMQCDTVLDDEDVS